MTLNALTKDMHLHCISGYKILV